MYSALGMAALEGFSYTVNINIFHHFMFSLDVTHVLLVSVNAFSYADVAVIIALKMWHVNSISSLSAFTVFNIYDIMKHTCKESLRLQKTGKSIV